MLEALITSKTRRKLLKLFLVNPASEFYPRQAERAIEGNIRGIRRELEILEAAGILQSRRQGNLKLYRANKACPIYDELKRIILKTEGIGTSLRNEFNKLGKARFAFIYGSYAKGDERPRSDIDIMLIGAITPKEVDPLIHKLEEKLGREINYIIYPEDEFLQRKSGFLEDVIRDKKIWLIGDENEFKRFVEGRKA